MTDTTQKNYQQKYEELKTYLKTFQKDGICIAYSGGVDSTLLLRAAVDAAAGYSVSDHPSAEKYACPSDLSSAETTASAVMIPTVSDQAAPTGVLAVILETQLHPHSDTEQAYEQAKKIGALPFVIQIDEFQNTELLHNPVNRCYLCKHLIFSSLKELAASRGYHAIFDGTNKDDENEYRPGMKVLKELAIHSPLLELGITKADVRAISAMLGLPTATVPSTPCLATRLPYGAYLDREVLANIHRGETWLRERGFYNVRLRYHEPILRLEIDCDEFVRLLEQRAEITAALKALGFTYITLDLEGFRSGSMDIHIVKNTL